MVFMQMAFVVDRHSLAWNGLHLQWLDNFSPLSAQPHHVPVEVCDISCPAAHPGFPQTQNLFPVQVLVLSSEKGSVRSCPCFFAQLWLFLYQDHDEIPG